ncbi:MAG TPA: peptidoglycan DD-metalloendopeptidase family protein, partial [Acidimicrobiales bacterium]|nr:peptidoglycan DD-metalloendopeptidase family protein [Acidimicrobiales bacterium]
VVFAGVVAGGLHVVVLHPDGIRTSYSFLRTIAVARGQKVVQGQALGTAADRLHFGARVGDAYIDPTSLFAGAAPEVHLVPDEERRPGSVAQERRGLAASLLGLGRLGHLAEGALRWVGRGAVAIGDAALDHQFAALRARVEELGGLVSNALDTNPVTHMARVARAVADWEAQRHDCTPASESPPPAPGRGHVAVQVAGLGSTSDRDDQSVAALDTAALGYGPGDVIRFSYRGGTSEEQPYHGRDTTTDIRTSARRLRQLLERVARERPGVPVDIIAHSQGGIVARQALAHETDAGDPQLPHLNALVLLGAPNTGADLATAANMVGHSTSGYAVETGLALARSDGPDLSGKSVHQLAETSSLLARLSTTPPPAGVHVTSIGARYDLVVPARHSRLEGAHNIVVDAGMQPDSHMTLPASAPAWREVALAIARRSPTCQSLPDMVTDAVATEVITHAEDTLSQGAWFVGKLADAKAGLPPLHR